MKQQKFSYSQQLKTNFMKTSKPKPAKKIEPPVFQVTVRQRGGKRGSAASNSTPQKRDNIFSKSRDTREDRGSRQMKTSHSSQTLPHVR
jgi:hypothetical protein